METQRNHGAPVLESVLDEMTRIFSESTPNGAERFLPLWNSTRKTFLEAMDFHRNGDEEAFRSLLGHIDGFIRADVGTVLGVNISDDDAEVEELRNTMLKISGNNGDAPEARLVSSLLTISTLILKYALDGNGTTERIKPSAAPAPAVYDVQPANWPSILAKSGFTQEDIKRRGAEYFNGDMRRVQLEETVSKAVDSLVHARVPAALNNLVSKVSSTWQYGAGFEQLRQFIKTMTDNPNVMRTLQANAGEFAAALVEVKAAIDALDSYIERQKEKRRPVNPR